MNILSKGFMRRFAIVIWSSLAIFTFNAAPTKADTVRMFDETSPYPIAVVGLALCSSTQSCHASLSNAIASFSFSPPATGGEFTINASDPAFAPIAGYLTMTDQQVAQNVPFEAIVPFFWNSGPNPGTFNFFTASNPNLNFFQGHFGTTTCVINGITEGCGFPIAGREIDSLSIIVTSNGEMSWTAQGVNIATETPTGIYLAIGLPFLLLLARPAAGATLRKTRRQ